MKHITFRILVVLCALFVGTRSASAQTLPTGWASTDIGAVGLAGRASSASGSFSVDGAGADVWGSADALHFAYTPLTGDGSVVTRVTGIENVNAWTKAGVMIRESLSANARQAFMLVSPGKGLAFQRRVATSGVSTSTGGGAGTAPAYVKLTRAGSSINAYASTNGSTWTLVGSDRIPMGQTVLVGVAVSSHIKGNLATATFDATTVAPAIAPPASAEPEVPTTPEVPSTPEAPITPEPPTTPDAPASLLPTDWASRDIGAVGIAGTASGVDGSFTVDGAGADVWGAADALHFTYTRLTGNASIVTRVSSVENVNAWTKAGVMIRESLDANARQAFMLVSPGKGLAFQRRTLTGGASTSTAGGAGTAAVYLKLVRADAAIRAYKSMDGSVWTLVGTDTIPMNETVYVGVGVSSHVAGNLATAAFDQTTITPLAVEPPIVIVPPNDGLAVPGTLRLLHWNTYHGGQRSNGKYDPANLVSWIKQFNPDIMTLNEVDTTAQANRIMTELRTQMPGIPWDYYFLGDMRGNMIVSRLPILSKSMCLVTASANRQVAHISVMVGGRTINVWDAHLALDSSAVRTAETRAIQACETNWTEARIVAGDFNMQPGTAEHKSMLAGHTDAWLTAKAMGTAINYAGNCDGCTRNSRIDYIFTSKAATSVVLKSVQIFDTRPAGSTVMASDHKPMLAIYDLK